METETQATVPELPIASSLPGVQWFWRHGCVLDEDGVKRVYIGGALIGEFDPGDRDRGSRNVLAVTLAKEPTMHLGRLAAAFGIGEEYLRRLRRIEETEGLGAVMKPARGCTPRPEPLDDNKRRELHALFAAGWNATDATRRQRRGKRMSRATVSRERRRWQAARTSEAIAAPAVAALVTAVGEQLDLPFAGTAEAATSDDAASGSSGGDGASVSDGDSPRATGDANAAATTDFGDGGGADDEGSKGALVALGSRPVISGQVVQDLGTWILMALSQRDGLYDEVVALGGSDGDRIAIDATLAALAIGEGTVEGVRRIATPSAPKLLRADHAPTASGVRRRLWEFAKQHGAELMARMGRRYVAAARGTEAEPAVFYVDNHLRPYTGQEVVRKGWRMQDRRVLPGTTDYYVHDEDGRPLFRIDVPSHDSLCQWLRPIGARLREALGDDERILLAFDRAGSFADELAALRDAGFEFVAYERKPFAVVAATTFDRTFEVRGERYGLAEQRLKNLGRGRGRVRRISLRTPDGNQINLLAVSTLPAEMLAGILLGREAEDDPSGRWLQENAFHHGVHRWGINQLDGRKVELVPSGTIIPNPARRRLERALTIVRADEGRARCVLAEPALRQDRRERAEEELAEAVENRVRLEMMRALVPKHAPVENTELAGKLVRHTGELKLVVDTLRVVCANVEADLAAMIAPHLGRPREAKKVVANVFAAPGRVDVTRDAIRVRLAPAANRSEQAGIRRLLRQLSAMGLTLPGDVHCRPLRFETHLS